MKKIKKENLDLPDINSDIVSEASRKVSAVFKKTMLPIQIKHEKGVITAIMTLPSRIEGEDKGESFFGTGSSKKEAKSQAAKALLNYLSEVFSV